MAIYVLKCLLKYKEISILDKGIKIKVAGEVDFTAKLKEYLDFCINFFFSKVYKN